MQLLIILFAGLIITQFFWVFTDPRPFKKRFEPVILKTYLLVTSVVLAQIIGFLFFPLPSTLFDLILTFLGIVFYVFGIIFASWAKLTMKAYWGPPGEHDIKRQNKLITTGPFAFSRHPIYVGITFLVLGFSLAIHNSLFFLVIVLVVYFYKTALAEEKLLKKYFGKEYFKYKKRVPRFLIIWACEPY